MSNKSIGDAISEIWGDIGCFVWVILFALMISTCNKCNAQGYKTKYDTVLVLYDDYSTLGLAQVIVPAESEQFVAYDTDSLPQDGFHIYRKNFTEQTYFIFCFFKGYPVYWRVIEKGEITKSHRYLKTIKHFNLQL